MGDSYYRWFPGDYLRDTGDLSMVEDCAYRRLLDHYYSEERLPSDISRLYRICRATAPEEQKAVDFIVGRFFTVEGDRLCNVRAEKELGERRKFIEEQTRKSTLGHMARWRKKMPVGMPVGTVRAPLGACPEVCPDDAPPSPSPLKDQNLLSESADSDSSKSPGNGKDTEGVQAFFDLWNEEVKYLPKATKLTEDRKRKIRVRLRERPLGEWGDVFRRMERSSFLRGESGGSFRADLGWIIANEGNALKVIEGRYDGRERRPAASPMRDVTGRVL